MLWVLRGSTFRQKSGECHDLQRKQIKMNVLKIKCTNRDNNYAAMIPGNPASRNIIIKVILKSSYA